MEKLLEDHTETDWLFSNLYKYKGKNLELSQQQRREKLLEEQKHRRHQVVDKHRELCESFLKEIDESEEMECDPEKPPKKSIYFKLMQSEWFIDIPCDLEENWGVKFCPQGFRILLIARNHITICYNRKGRIVLKIRTNFPGGRRDLKGITILDCIYNKATRTIFILDCLFWNSMSLLDSEANFRFYWLKNKFEENPEMKKYLKFNFMLLDFVPAQRPMIQDEMFNLLPVGDQRLPYDGVVFYHKEAHYTFGYTPLVGWLASYMLSEKLHIDVCPENLLNRPEDYTSMESYLETLKHRYKKRRKSKIPVDVESEMEVH